MTKLTIQLDGKTFVPKNKNMYTLFDVIEDWVEDGDLVELQPQEEKTEETHTVNSQIFYKHMDRYQKLEVILNKLRSELETYVKHWSSVPVKQNCYKQILSLLNELEKEDTPKEVFEYIKKTQIARGEETQPELNYCDSRTDEERARDEELYNTAVVTSTSNVWTPTPGEMIEVSNDGKRWKTEEFVEAEPRLLGGSIYLTKVGWTYTYSQYARPAPEELNNEWAKEAGRDFAKKHLSQPIEKLNTEWRNIEIQIHAITSTLNTLIERINNK